MLFRLFEKIGFHDR